MSVVTTIPKEKAKGLFAGSLKPFSGNHSVSTVDMIAGLNRQLAGWAAFYKFTDFTAHVFRRIDHVVFWKIAHSRGHKYRSRIKPLMRKWYRAPEPGKAKTWFVFGRNERGGPHGKALHRLVSSPKAQFRWRNPRIIHTSSEKKPAALSPPIMRTLLWPWAKLEQRAVCAERCTYGSGRRSALALFTPLPTAEGWQYLAAVM
ncbi:hypothetical protein ABH973_000753 [Bradyrhizobium ottawaense]